MIAANAGGAWTPIGDVTTTMLWIHGQISTLQTMKVIIYLFLSSFIVKPILIFVIVMLSCLSSYCPSARH